MVCTGPLDVDTVILLLLSYCSYVIEFFLSPIF